MACGHLPPGERAAKPEGLTAIGEIPWPYGVCPGWALQQPLVGEAWEAYRAAKLGILALLRPHAPKALLDAVMVADRVRQQYLASRGGSPPQESDLDG